jgi:hypothetical protein
MGIDENHNVVILFVCTDKATLACPEYNRGDRGAAQPSERNATGNQKKQETRQPYRAGGHLGDLPIRHLILLNHSFGLELYGAYRSRLPATQACQR